MAADVMLEGRGLRLTYRGADRSAVDGVSLQVRAGETLGVVGESGCGKSTLCRLLTRLERPDEGVVLLEGRDVTHLSGRGLRQLRPRFQYVFQNPFSCFDPCRSIGSSLEEPLRQHGIGDGREGRRERIAETLESCGLSQDLLSRRPRELSGGQLQRLALVRALVLRPRVLVCDEVVSALDAIVQAQVLDLLERLISDFGLAVLFVSHDLAVVRRVSDRVLVMRRGRVVDEGTPGYLFHESQVGYTRELVAAVPRL